MEIYITRNGQQHGPYSPDDVANHIKTGDLKRDDLAWYDGCADWMPLMKIPGLALPSSSPPPPPALPAYTPSIVEPTKKSATFLDLFKSDKSQQPAVHINVNKKGCGSSCGTIFVALIVLGFIGSLFNKEKPEDSQKETSSGTVIEKKIPDGNQALFEMGKVRDIKGTTVQREDALKAVERKYAGKTLEFDGTVYDVESDEKVEVKIDSGNYANVLFKDSSSAVHNLKKGSYIKFTATLSAFGTGILFKHDLTDAKLLP